MWYDRHCVLICCGGDQKLQSCLNTIVLSKLYCIRVSDTAQAFLRGRWTLAARVRQRKQALLLHDGCDNLLVKL